MDVDEMDRTQEGTVGHAPSTRKDEPMFMTDIEPFLESQGWKQMAVFPSKNGHSSGPEFHLFHNDSSADLCLLIEDLAGNNGIELWVKVVDDLRHPRIAALRDVMREREPWRVKEEPSWPRFEDQ